MDRLGPLAEHVRETQDREHDNQRDQGSPRPDPPRGTLKLPVAAQNDPVGGVGHPAPFGAPANVSCA